MEEASVTGNLDGGAGPPRMPYIFQTKPKSKKDKDKEIHNLNEELEKFRKTIEKNNNLYESMLDKTTQSLEKIISNTQSLSKIQ